MAKKLIVLFVMLLAGYTAVWAQTPHSTPEMRAKSKERSDYALFRRQISALKEFADEKKKIGPLQKETKEVVKVYATVDSTETDDTTHSKFLTGFITQQVGETTNNAYELTFDRAARKITNIKRTGESQEPEAAEEKAKPAAPAVKKADGEKKTTPAPGKKKKDPDEEEDEEEEKEEKSSGKEKDE